MKPIRLITISFVAVAAVFCITTATALLMLRETTIVIAVDGVAPSDEQMERIAWILRERITAFGDAAGVRSGKVEHKGSEFIVKLRGMEDLTPFGRVLTSRSAIELYLAADDDQAELIQKTGTLPEGVQKRVIVHEFLRLGSEELEKKEEPIILPILPEMAVSRFKTVRFDRDGMARRPIITVEFEPADAARFAQITRTNISRRLALMIDGEVFTAPTIQAEIVDGRVQIQNIINARQARRLYELLRIGTLTIPLKAVNAQQPD